MKKLGIMIFALLFAGMGIVNAQQQQQRKTQMRTYFQQTVLPFVEQQQAKFEKALSSTEKVTLENIRKEMTAFQKQGAQIRKSMQGNFNQQVRDSRKAQFDAILAKARKLTDAHPKEAEAYKKAIESEMPKWEQQRQAMTQRKMNGREQGHGMRSKNRQPRMQKLSDPALGLLLNGSQMNGMMMHNRQGMQGNRQGMRGNPRGMKGNRPVENMNRRHPFMMKAMENPEIRAKVKAYAEKNIFPVISKKRKAFDEVLSKKEKKVIAEARLQIQAQKARMRQMRGNSKRTMDDSSRLAMRQQMDKNRVALQQIALNHFGELQKQLASIKEKMPQWRAGIHNIIMPNQTPPQINQKGMPSRQMKGLRKGRKEIMFLLFDPQHPDNNLFMPPMKGNKRK